MLIIAWGVGVRPRVADTHSWTTEECTPFCRRTEGTLIYPASFPRGPHTPRTRHAGTGQKRKRRPCGRPVIFVGNARSDWVMMCPSSCLSIFPNISGNPRSPRPAWGSIPLFIAHTCRPAFPWGPSCRCWRRCFCRTDSWEAWGGLLIGSCACGSREWRRTRSFRGGLQH